MYTFVNQDNVVLLPCCYFTLSSFEKLEAHNWKIVLYSQRNGETAYHMRCVHVRA